VNIKELSQKFGYNPDTGDFTHKADSPRGRIGDLAGTVNSLGYRTLCVGGKNVYAHRVAWFLHYGEDPKGQIDHIDGDRANNRISNLRVANNQENSKNSKRYTTNKTGVTGVRYYDGDRFLSSITVDGKTTHLGVYNNLLDAACARKSAEARYGYHENHGRRC